LQSQRKERYFVQELEPRRPIVRATAAALRIAPPILAIAVVLASAGAGATVREHPLEGYGADTPGGEGGVLYEVTSLADAGPGTLRDAVSASNRVITFAVAGRIELASTVRIATHNLTIDGSTAPDAGIVIVPANSAVTGALVELRGCHDIILRHVRISDAPDTSAGDNLRIWDGASDIVIDHCSLRRAGDGCLDISDGAHDVTVQWCIIAETVKNSLVRTDVSDLSLHHNLYDRGDERNPQLDDAANVDMVNNVIFDWASNYGTRVRNGATANLIKNYYIAAPRSDASDAVVISPDAGGVYLDGNVFPPSCPAAATTGARYPAPAVTEMAPTAALAAVLAEAGAFPRDDEDEDYVAGVTGSAVHPASWGKIKSFFR
jgi:pectate lyase